MDYYELFKEIQDQGFDEKTALLTTIAQALHVSTKIKSKDLSVKNHFAEKITKKIKKTLWEYSDIIEDVITLESVLHDYSLQKVFAGISGCEGKTLKQLYNDKKEGVL